MISMLQLSWKHNYTWHHTHYIWHHSHCICAATPTVSIDHNSFGSYRTWHTYDIIHTLHDITITLYDIITQYLWHHSHCIHDIRYTTYDITSRVYNISSPIAVTSRLNLCEYISTIFNIKHTGQRQYNHYIWNHNLHMCIHVITHTVSMI